MKAAAGAKGAIVRPLDAKDAAEYQALRLRALRESPTAFSSSYDEEADRSPSDIVARVTPAADGSKCVFGAFFDGALAGMVTLVRPTRPKIRHVAEIAGMYVAPERRRQQIGRLLLDAAVTHARALSGVRQIKLGVNASNTAARQLYESIGFVRYGVEPDALYVDGRYYDEELRVLGIVSNDADED